jgi:hypothetical protein
MIRRFLLSLVLALGLFSPALAADYVLKSPDRASFMQAAYGLGYATADKDGNLTLVPTGISADGGNYFINEVGVVYEPAGATTTDAMGNKVPTMAPIPGYWVRIRVNNGRPLPDVPQGFELFPPVRYLADGVTIDPDYVQPPYGFIA